MEWVAMTEPSETKRHYLRADDRRRSILDVAADVVASRGLAHLSMAGVAAEAGVSRQLLYRYFDGLDDLVLAMVTQRFATIIASYDAQATVVAPLSPNVARNQIHLALHLAAPDQRLLRNVFGDVDQLPEDVRRAVLVIRERLVERWVGIVDVDQSRRAVVRAGVWAVFHAIFGIWDYLADGSITTDEAYEIALGLAQSIGGIAGGSPDDGIEVAPA
ncbi:MAG: TetR/AcrR family transcriptional regulator [Acidimicrobiales bacterium]